MGAGGAEGRQLRVGGGGPRRSENWGVLIWAFLLPQGSYWSSNHSEPSPEAYHLSQKVK